MHKFQDWKLNDAYNSKKKVAIEIMTKFFSAQSVHDQESTSSALM